MNRFYVLAIAIGLSGCGGGGGGSSSSSSGSGTDSVPPLHVVSIKRRLPFTRQPFGAVLCQSFKHSLLGRLAAVPSTTQTDSTLRGDSLTPPSTVPVGC